MNLVATGMFAFVGFSFPTSRLLPNSYYHVKNKNLNDQIYYFLGVHFFRKFLLLTFWKSKTKMKSFFNGTKSGLEAFMFSSKQAEFGHLGAFVFIQVYGVLMSLKGNVLLVFSLTIINVIFNLYPILLQRKHRIRIQKILSKETELQ